MPALRQPLIEAVLEGGVSICHEACNLGLAGTVALHVSVAGTRSALPASATPETSVRTPLSGRPHVSARSAVRFPRAGRRRLACLSLLGLRPEITSSRSWRARPRGQNHVSRTSSLGCARSNDEAPQIASARWTMSGPVCSATSSEESLTLSASVRSGSSCSAVMSVLARHVCASVVIGGQKRARSPRQSGPPCSAAAVAAEKRSLDQDGMPTEVRLKRRTKNDVTWFVP